MLTFRPIPSLRNPEDVLREVLSHVAAIDVLVNGVKWASPDAEFHAEDVGVYLTDAVDQLKRAVKEEDEWHLVRGE